MRGEAFPIERGFRDVCRESPRLSPINDMPQSERISRRRCKKGKTMPDEETFLNPDFWQAVGLTLRRRETRTCTACDKGERKCPWHQFIDHLAAGKAPKAFFTSLSFTEKKQS
jgi:hypothetical protein